MASLAGGALGLLGAGVSAFGTIMGAEQGASALEAQKPYTMLAGIYRSQGLQQAADEERAAAQQTALGQVREKEMLLSKGKAIAAASGAGAGPSDTSAVNLQAGIEQRGAFDKLMTMYQGENRARGLEYEAENALKGGFNKAAAQQYEADVTKKNAKMAAAGMLLSGAATAFSKYNTYG